jgi:hypothetical protein
MKTIRDGQRIQHRENVYSPASFLGFETSLGVMIEIAAKGACYEADRGTLQDEA